MARLYRKGQKTGFTLIELMIVIAIIGILAAIAVPNFFAWLCRSRATEGHAAFAAMWKGSEGYLANGELQSQPLCAGAETRNHVGSDNSWYCLGITAPDWHVGRRYTLTYGKNTKTADQKNDGTLTGSLADCSGFIAPLSSVISGFGWTANACGNIDSDLTIDAGQMQYQRPRAGISNDCMD